MSERTSSEKDSASDKESDEDELTALRRGRRQRKQVHLEGMAQDVEEEKEVFYTPPDEFKQQPAPIQEKAHVNEVREEDVDMLFGNSFQQRVSPDKQQKREDKSPQRYSLPVQPEVQVQSVIQNTGDYELVKDDR